MPEQLTFDLPVRTALGHDDFFVSGANRVAVAAVGDWAHWIGAKLVLIGPKGSGKTHLTHVWATQADAVVIAATDIHTDEVAGLIAKSPHIAVEDVEDIAGNPAGEEALFHLHNLALADGGRVLMTSRNTPTKWPLVLPDLQSRILGTGMAVLDAPDDALLSAVLVKLFNDRQIDVSPDVIGYLVRNMERSFDTANRLVSALDAQALSQRRAITRNLAASVLDNIGRENP